MSDKTKIEWADATVNAINGCDPISPGCTNCYAMASGGRNLPGHPSTGLTKATKAGHVWTGEVRLNEKALLMPLSWKRPRHIFWNAHGDTFHENVPDEWIDRMFAVMALTPHHIHMVLTKRPERMRAYLTEPRWHIWAALARKMIVTAPKWTRPTDVRGRSGTAVPMPHVWLGTSVEDQARANERIPHLLATPAAVRFLSCEPLLGPVDLSSLIFVEEECPNWLMEGSTPPVDPETGAQECCTHCDYTGCVSVPKIDWVILGGESGPKARPMHPDWARSLRDQCAAAGVAFHFKQWGEWALDSGPDKKGRDPIMNGLVRCAVRVGEDWQYFSNGYEPSIHLASGNGEWVYRLGKKRAGRLLDGVEHSEFPA